jgi:Mrp family chromosome partitioning ATPase
VVDANVVSARVSHLLGKTNPVSFSAKLSSVREQCIHVGGNLWLAGTDLMIDGRGGLLPFDELKHRFDQLSSAFDFLLVDAPGAAVSEDAEILGTIADAAVLVVEANKTRRNAVAKVRESLDAAGVRLLGTVLNDRTFPIPGRLEKFL